MHIQLFQPQNRFKMLKIDFSFVEYQTSGSNIKEINWWCLPEEIKLELNEFPFDIKKLGNFTTIRRLKDSKQRKKITTNIIAIKKEMMGCKCFKVKFPINLNSKEYAKLYALMISEGSHNTEFSINVPEKEFHALFNESIERIISEEAARHIKVDNNHQIQRSRAPAILRHLIPIPKIIPSVIFSDKELARECLKVSFEAEGSPIFNKKHKRYIKLTRYKDITNLVTSYDLLDTTRIYAGTIKKVQPELWNKIKEYPPETLLGEHLMLKHHFNVDNKLILEAIRKNKTDFRAGKITARWVLLIYANNINKFIKEINFISENKIRKCQEMLKIRANNPQYFSFGIIKSITKHHRFNRKDFVNAMRTLGYKSPGCYLWRYESKKLIKKIGKGNYQLLMD